MSSVHDMILVLLPHHGQPEDSENVAWIPAARTLVFDVQGAWNLRPPSTFVVFLHSRIWALTARTVTRTQSRSTACPSSTIVSASHTHSRAAVSVATPGASSSPALTLGDGCAPLTHAVLDFGLPVSNHIRPASFLSCSHTSSFSTKYCSSGA